jgi:hypothetical protein
MPDILHKVGIKSASLDNVYKALATVEGLSRWWTSDTQGESKVGGVLQFRFGGGGFDMKVLELQPGKRVLWEVVDGPEEWLGTKISFDLKQNGDWTVVSSSTKAGRSRWNSCTTAVPSGRFSC